jgi:SAM-dependent methyltransferase
MERTEYALMAAVEDDMWWYRALHTRLLEALKGVRGRVLDAGCGTGGFLKKLRRRRPELGAFGCDYAAEGVDGTAAKSDALVVRASVDRLPFVTNCFDAVVTADVLCHVAVDPPRALAELERVLIPGGKLVVNMPAFTWLMSAHDRRVQNARRFTAGEMVALLKRAGFRDVRASYWNSLLLPLLILHRKLQRSSEEASSDVRPFGACLNWTLHAITEVERSIPFAMLAGASIIATARKSLD